MRIHLVTSHDLIATASDQMYNLLNCFIYIAAIAIVVGHFLTKNLHKAPKMNICMDTEVKWSFSHHKESTVASGGDILI